MKNRETAFEAQAIELVSETDLRRQYYEATTLLRVAFRFSNGIGSLGAKRYHPEPQLNQSGHSPQLKLEHAEQYPEFHNHAGKSGDE